MLKNTLMASILFGLMAMTGCAIPKMDDQTLERISTHKYSGFSNETIIKAAEKIITDADPDDTGFSPYKDGFISNRIWYNGFDANVFGETLMTFQVEKRVNDSVHLRLTLSGKDRLRPLQKKITQNLFGDYTYEIFWKRLDYALGLTDVWYSCRLAKIDREAGKIYLPTEAGGTFNPFCDTAYSSAILPNGFSEWEGAAQAQFKSPEDYKKYYYKRY